MPEYPKTVLIEGRWKGIQLKRRDAPIQLYDVQQDLGETNNVAAQYPARVEQVRRLFATEHGESMHWPLRDAKPAAAKAER